MKPENLERTPFVVRAYDKIELARLYLGRYTDRIALRRFNEWLQYSPQLWKALQSTGVDVSTRYFTPRQVEIIVEHLGEPEYNVTL